jgi:replicative DNA helicase
MGPSPIVSRWANEIAEQRLIHKIVCGREKHLLDEVEAEDFYGEANQRIIAACKSLVAKNRTPDLVTLGSVTDAETVMLVSGYRKAELAEEYGYDPSNYASVLKELRKRREAYTAIHNAMAALQDPNNETSTDEVMAMTMESIHKGNQDTAHDMATVLTKTLATIQARQRGEITPVSTGIPAMDDASGGLYPGEMTVIGARPGTGKTALTLQIAEHAAANGHRAVFVSREMSDVQIGERVFARHGVKMGRSRTGKLNDDDWSRMTSTVNLDAFRNILVDNRSTTVAQIRTSCRRWKARGGLDLVCVDYLQLVHSDNNGSRNDQVAAISWAFKELAVELDVPVLLLSQLSREIRSRQDGEPQLTDLRDSGAIEQDADNVWLLFSPKTVEDPEVQALIDFNSGESNRAVVAIKIAKARQSIPGIVYTQFIKDEMRFLGTTPEPLPEQIDLGGLYE